MKYMEKLGHGAFGTVRLCTKVHDKNSLVSPRITTPSGSKIKLSLISKSTNPALGSDTD